MKPPPGVGFLVGLGVMVTVLMLRSREDSHAPVPSITQAPPPPSPPASFQLPGEDEQGPAAPPADPLEQLAKLSGKWASGDGSVSATFDYRMLHFHETKGWPDLDGKTFLLGSELQFLSEAGLYSIGLEDSEPSKLRIIKEDRGSKDLISFSLFREGDPRCRARPPFSDTPPPPEIQAILDEIPSIRLGESADALLKRLVFPRVPTATPITGMTSAGQSDDVWSLGGEWLLKLSETNRDGVVRFQIARGTAKPLEYSEYRYPYYVWKKLVTGVAASGLQEFRAVDR